MKKLFSFLWILNCQLLVFAQPLITSGEYFIDFDPGFGNATSFTLPPSSDVSANIAIDVSSISSGIHILFIRVQDSDLKWSLSNVRPFIKISPTNLNFEYGEYFFNSDPGFGNATAIPVAQDTTLDITFPLNLSSISDGFNIFYVRFKNSQGVWSITQNKPIYKISNPNSDIERIEYFWDNDPGVGNGLTVPFAADTNILVVFPADISSISDGFHNFYIRVKNALGIWSITSIKPIFKVSNANSNITSAEYFIDTDPGFGNGTSILLDSSVQDLTQNFLVDLTNVSGGLHTIYVRVQNADGLWSFTHNRPFLRVSGSDDLVRFEYFFNNDPGHGSGNTILLNPTQDTSWTGIIDISALPNAYHRLYVRAQDTIGNYSLTHSKRFAFCNGPQINIGTFTDTICLGASVSVWDSTTNLNVSTKYEWDWEGDGIVDDTTLGSISHTYIDTGTYYLTLIATSFDTCYDSASIQITVLPPPVASFVADTVCRTFLTSFSDSSFTAIPTQFAWDFDNDFIGDSTNAGDVQYLFPTAGIFPINLMLDMGYNCLDTFTALIEVKEKPDPLFSSPGNCLGERSFLVDQSSALLPGAGYFWDVQGDGIIDDTTSGTINRIYPDSGLYSPMLIIDNKNGCIDTFSSSVKIHGLPLLNTVSTSPTCFGGFDGTATVNVIGDPTKYTYRWTDENKQTTQTALGLYARRYFVSVLDSNGCFNRDTVEVINPLNIDLSVFTTDAICGQNTGTATLTINSGQAPFEVYWTNGDTINNISNLAAGIYLATVTDAQGCSNIIPALVSNTNAPNVSFNSITDVSCYGLEDGAIDVDISGGASPYSISWSNQGTTEDISNLDAGPYEIKVTGSDGCIAFARAIVGEPDKLLVDIQGFDSYCGLPTGSAQASVVGGVGAISYSWPSGGNASFEPNLNAGVYTLNVTDTNNCTAVGYVAISDTGSASIFVDSIVDVTCGLVDGGMYIKVLKVRGEPQYLWSNGDTTEDLINVNIGLHYVQVSDSNSCKAFEFGVLEYIAPIPNPICLITIDTLDSINVREAIFVVWEKLNNPAVQGYNVYKETTQGGVYHKIGNVKRNDPGLYIDTFSNIQNRWWKYKITVMDSCGNESDINAVAASAHKTINLHSSLNATQDTFNLIWDEYIGFNYSKYYIYRYTNLDGYNLLDSVDVPGKTYADVTFPQADTIIYFVFVNNTFECDPNKADDYGRTRSNTSFNSPIFVGIPDWNMIDRLRIYPNPARDHVYIDYNKKIEEVIISNPNGGLVEIFSKYDKEKGLNIKNLASGVYFLKLFSSEGVLVKKLIKE